MIFTAKTVTCIRLIQCLALVVNFLFSVNAIGAGDRGTESGGGGGEAHDLFIAAGHRVLYYLKFYPDGQKIVRDHNLSLCRLRKTLDNDLVFVYNDKNGMQDHRGSESEGYASRWKILIANKVWKDSFSKERNEDVYHVVFKEMIRSQQTTFFEPIDISQKIKPFPRELFLDRAVDITPVQMEMETCLTDEDRQIIDKVRKDNELFRKYLKPTCTDHDLNPSYSDLIDQLLELARLDKCVVETSACYLNEELSSQGGDEYLLWKSIYWRGRPIFKLKFALINKKSGEYIPLGDNYYEELIEDRLAELEDDKIRICTPTGRKFQRELPNEGVVIDYWKYKDLDIPYAYLLPNYNQERYSGLVGVGSRFKLLDPKIYLDGGSSGYIKVKIIANTINQIDLREGMSFNNERPPFFPEVPLRWGPAKVGDVGYIRASFTNLYKYFHLSRQLKSR